MTNETWIALLVGWTIADTIRLWMLCNRIDKMQKQLDAACDFVTPKISVWDTGEP